MEAAQHLESLRQSSETLATVARQGLDFEIPSCPGWCMADLVWHTGMAVHWGATMVPVRARAASTPTEPGPPPQSPADHELIEWFEDGSAQLVRALVEVDPHDTLGLDWTEQGYPGPSLYRHYAREVGVHRWDAQLAHGAPEPLDDDVAAEWLDGVLTTWLPAAARQGRQAQGAWAGQSVHFHRTDGHGEWTVTLHGPGAVETTRDHRSADLTVRGPGSALLLLAMNRIPLTHDALEAAGDGELLDRWKAQIRYGRPASGAHFLGSPRPGATASRSV